MQATSSSREPTTATSEAGHTVTSADAGSRAALGLKKLVILLLIAASVLLTVHFTPLGDYLKDFQKLREQIDGNGIGNELKFAAISAVLMTIGAPRLALYALAGLLFGVAEGFFAATLAGIASSYGSFRLIRWIGHDWVSKRFSQNRFFRLVTEIRPTVFSVFLVRQLPVSNAFINATLALSPVRDYAFIAGSLLGFTPQGAVAVLIGAGAATEFLHSGVIHLVLAAIGIAGCGLWMWRRSLRANSSPVPIDEP